MIRFLLILSLSLTAGTALADSPYEREDTEPLVVCTATSGLLGAPTYAVEWDPVTYEVYLAKYPLAPVDPLRVRVPMNQVWGYDGVVIVRANFGRSGYALLYADLWENTSLIDFNVFLYEAFNTDGPVTDYLCELAIE
jgi:hypothetical protein